MNMPEIYYAVCKECMWESDATTDPHEARKAGYAHKKEDFHIFTVNREWWDKLPEIAP
jgi:hypothetical protein